MVLASIFRWFSVKHSAWKDVGFLVLISQWSGATPNTNALGIFTQQIWYDPVSKSVCSPTDSTSLGWCCQDEDTHYKSSTVENTGLTIGCQWTGMIYSTGASSAGIWLSYVWYKVGYTSKDVGSHVISTGLRFVIVGATEGWEVRYPRFSGGFCDHWSNADVIYGGNIASNIGSLHYIMHGILLVLLV